MFAFLKSPDWSREGIAWPNRWASRFVDAGAYRWHVQRAGAGPVALLVHGTGAATHSWAGLLPLLMSSFDVIAFDLPGHGFTQAKHWRAPSLPHVAAEIGLLLEALGAAPNLIVGHSAGAAIMFRMAADRVATPHAGVSINGALTPFEGLAGLAFPAMAKMLYYNPAAAFAFAQGARDPDRVRRLIEQTGSAVDEAQLSTYATLLKNPGHVAGALGMMAHWDLRDMTAAIAAAKFPVLFLAGAKDRAVPPQTARDAAAAAKHETAILDGVGHLAHEEAPGRIASMILDFTARAAAP